MHTRYWDNPLSAWEGPRQLATCFRVPGSHWKWLLFHFYKLTERIARKTDSNALPAMQSVATPAEQAQSIEASPRCFEELLSEHGDTFKRVAATYESNVAKQQELFQEICLAVWLAIPVFKGASSLKTYMLRIAHNRSVQHVANEVKHKHIGNTEDLDVFAGHSDTHAELEQQHDAVQLMSLVRELPIQQRQVFALLMEGLAYKDIAEITGLTSQNVGVTIMRVKQTLKEGMSGGK